jgi:hypothetical protein
MGFASVYLGKMSYDWCLDYKEMGKRCTTSTGSREWTKEEKMAYLDWSNAEDARIDARVATVPRLRGGRGMRDVWDMVARDIEEQKAVYSARK